MSFNVQPKAGPNILAPPSSQATNPSPQASTARERAIMKLTGGNQVQEHPVPNANNVAPEDMSAIAPKTSAPEGQINTSGDEPQVESPKEATPPKEEPALSSQYANLARKERALRAREAAFKQREAAIAAREEALKPKAPEQPAFDPNKYIDREKFRKDPFGTLVQEGLTYEDITQAALNAPSPDQIKLQQTISRLEAKIQELESGQQKVVKTYEEQQIEARKQAVNQIRSEVKSLVQSDATSYEAIKETDSYSDVVELIERTFDEEGVLLSVEEAAQAVEEELAERLFNYSNRIKKVRQKLAPQATPAAPKAPEVKSQPKQQAPMKTLTNAVGVSRQLSARERAILAFKGELKN